MGSTEFYSASLSVEKLVVKRTEQIWLKSNKILRYFCHLSKNLYNEANYRIRKTLRMQNLWIRYNELCNHFKTSPNYKALPAKSAQQTLINLDRNWKSFFAPLKKWKFHPENFKAKPNPPRYQPKDGEHILVLTNQQVHIRGNNLKFPKIFDLKVKTRLSEDSNLREARIIPKNGEYVLEIVYEREIPPIKRNPNRVAGIDLGVRNLVTLGNNVGKPPIIVKGGVAKSINQFYNKELARVHQIYTQQGIKTGKKLKKLLNNRNRKLHDHFHKVSRLVVDWCVRHNVGTLVIGYNKEWKQNIKMGKITTQTLFTSPLQN